MKHDHIKNKKSKHFTLLIVPQSDKVKQMKMPTWLPKTIISFVVISLIVATVYTWNLYNKYTYIKNNYQSKVEKINTLKAANKKQHAEIIDLKQKTSEVEKKLKTISDLQKTVKEMVGLESNISKNTSNSRGGERIVNKTVNLLSEENFETKMDVLSKELDKGKSDLSELISDVEKRLRFLEAKPDLMPTTGKISSGYGYRKNPFGRGSEFHYGIDISNNYGVKIKAAGEGIVTYSGYNGGFGRMIIISHGYGYQSIYGHNNKLLVKVGTKVDKGQVIAKMGNTGKSTGPHLHFEVRYYGKPVNPTKILRTFK
ncbi:MAG: M23 family metallopeptidase [Firmicutes bacterium]|nr:M23 family metallopeptidase [Bacillota bacterium]